MLREELQQKEPGRDGKPELEEEGGPGWWNRNPGSQEDWHPNHPPPGQHCGGAHARAACHSQDCGSLSLCGRPPLPEPAGPRAIYFWLAQANA